jgi:predicted ATP-dependent serine protease
MNLDYKETEFTKLNDIKIPESFYKRLKTGNAIIDNFFSGGLTPGSSFTFTGNMGSGKSGFILQYLDMLAKQGYRTGVCSSEEIVAQVAYTCKRLNVTNVEIANISNVDRVSEALYEFDIVVVDSFQGLTHPNYDGKVRAIEKYAVETLYTAAKAHETVLGFICHVTKSGDLKGGTIVPHTVDMNMIIERSEEDEFGRKISMTKNRFGACNELQCTLTGTGYDFNETALTMLPVNIAKKNSKSTIHHLLLRYLMLRNYLVVTKLKHTLCCKKWLKQIHLRKMVEVILPRLSDYNYEYTIIIKRSR